jgi:hypothetical protein
MMREFGMQQTEQTGPDGDAVSASSNARFRKFLACGLLVCISLLAIFSLLPKKPNQFEFIEMNCLRTPNEASAEN